MVWCFLDTQQCMRQVFCFAYQSQGGMEYREAKIDNGKRLHKWDSRSHEG